MIFFTDLDNTIIYSYKHDIGSDKINVELYQGRNISFVTGRTHKLLTQLREKMPVVPVSTRTVEQYERIDLRTGLFEYALVCNGGVLLKDGQRVDAWYRESLEVIKESESALNSALNILESDSRRTFELRFIEKLFVFTKCDEPEQVVADLKVQLHGEPVEVFNNGTKVYVVPGNLSKGKAVERFLKWVDEHDETGKYRGACLEKDVACTDWADVSARGITGIQTIAAGDSEFDISMLETVDIGLAPNGFADKFAELMKCGTDSNVSNIFEMQENMIFSDALLGKCLELAQG